MKKIVIVLILSFLAGCTPKNRQIDVVFLKNAEFAKDSTVNSCTLIKQVDDLEITPEMYMDNYIDINGERMSCETLDTSEVGVHKVMFNYKKQVFEVEYTVVDKEAPKIIVDEDIYLEPGDEFDIDKYIQFTDNDYAEGIVSGYLDVDSKGIYELTIQCKDKSNNYVEKKVNVHVGNGTKVISTNEKNMEEQKRNEIYAERLVAQLEILEKEQQEKIAEEQKVITQEEIDAATKVYDPTCQLGEYEIEAKTALEAAMIAMNLYDCWHVEVELIPEPEPEPTPTPEPVPSESPEPIDDPEQDGNPEDDELSETPTVTPEVTEELDSIPVPEETEEPIPTLTPEPKIPKFKVKCICTMNSQKYQNQ